MIAPDPERREYIESLLSERKRALEESRSGDRLSVAIDHLAEAIIITDAAGTIEYVNPAFTRITGFEREEAIGQTPRLLKSGKHPDTYYRSMWETLHRGETWSGRLQNRRKDGELILEEARISPVRDGRGETTHYVAVKRDITAEVELEHKLRESQKLEAVGTLAGGIAHDFNNILYAMLGYAQLALDELDPDAAVFTYVQEIAKAGERASDLVTKMLAFGQRTASSPTAVRVQDVAVEALDLARASLPSTIRFDLDLRTDCPEVLADPTHIHQALMNLCTNAGHAMRDRGGVLTVELEAVDVDERAARSTPALKPGRWARLRVADTGVGIDPALIERVFEPYFTTKKSDEGTGLGLAIVHGIVRNHGGTITIDSEVGRGTRVALYLPLAGTAALQAPQKLPARDVRGGARVLVVDDEEMIVDVAVRGLTRLGFEVTGFLDGVEALEVFRRDPDAFDIVVTDQTMPGITGFELAAKLLALRPALPIILTTGYADVSGEEKIREAGFCRLLSKPLKIKDLAEAIEESVCTPATT